MKAVVVALGKIGLPLATQIARAGHEVIGCDIDAATVDLVNAAQPPFPGEDGLAEALAEVVGDGRLRATTDTAPAVAGGAELVIAVPPLLVDADARPDWGTLDAVLADIGAGLQAGTTVAVETTLPVGTTRDRVAPALAPPQRPARRGRVLLPSSAPSASTAGASSATSRPTPSCSAGSARPARPAGSSSTAASSTPRSGRWAPPRPPS